MFRIGEFSHIARVSIRQLRYYEEIGLLAPAHTDASSGYRSYEAGQLPRLNQILALKKLGLSLEEIKRVVTDDADTDELRALLQTRRREAAELISKEEARFREIEARLRQIETRGELADYDVVLKAGLQQWYVSWWARFADLATAIGMIREFARDAKRALPRDAAQNMLLGFGERGFTTTDFELEVGFLLSRPLDIELPAPDGGTARVREINDDFDLATIVRAGPPEIAHLASNALGYWTEAQDHEIAGPPREMILGLNDFLAGQPVFEVQFPVRAKSAASGA